MKGDDFGGTDNLAKKGGGKHGRLEHAKKKKRLQTEELQEHVNTTASGSETKKTVVNK